MKSTENLLEVIGCHYKYQKIVTLLYFLAGTFIDFSVVIIPIMLGQPIVDYIDNKGIKRTEELNEIICTDYKENYRINYEKSLSSWVISLDIGCKPSFVSLINTSFLVGNLLGLLSLQLVKNESKELICKFMITVFISSILFIAFNNVYTICILNFLQGFAQLSFLALKNSIITEITCKKYRSIYINILSMSTIASTAYSLICLSLKLHWRYIIGISILMLIFINIASVYYIITNPVYLAVNKDFNNASKSSKYIYKFNNMNQKVKSKIDTSKCNTQMSINKYNKSLISNRNYYRSKSFEEKFNNNIVLEDSLMENFNIRNFSRLSNIEDSINLNVNNNNTIRKISLNDNLKTSLKDIYNKNLNNKQYNSYEKYNSQNINADNIKFNLNNNSNINNKEIINVCSLKNLNEYSNNNSEYFKKYIESINALCISDLVEQQILEKKKYPLGYTLVLLIVFICSSTNIYFNIYENKEYINVKFFEYYILGSTFLCIPVFLLVSICMNSQLLGRKYTLVVLNLILIGFRLSYLVFNFLNPTMFYILRIFSISTQIPQHTLITESYPNKIRVKYYSMLYVIVKVFIIGCPVIYQILTYWQYNLMTMVYSFICILTLIFFVKETRGVSLKDY